LTAWTAIIIVSFWANWHAGTPFHVHSAGGDRGSAEMVYEVDAELAPTLTDFAGRQAEAPRATGDRKALRVVVDAALSHAAALSPPSPAVMTATFATAARGGVPVGLRWYTRPGATSGSAVVYAHGGAMIAGTLDQYDALVSRYVARTGVPFLAVQYRLTPELTWAAPAEDVLGGVLWLIEHAAELAVDPARIAVMGNSGGAAAVAGATVLARDQNVGLARQILVGPMLDDRTGPPDPARAALMTWTYEDNVTAWRAVLGEDQGGASVSPLVAPARLADRRGLPAAYVEVGDLDLHRDEAIAYAQGLACAGVPVELHVHAGMPHGWDRIAPRSDAAQRVLADRARTIASI
jgi:acetyl esterase/lipase